MPMQMNRVQQIFNAEQNYQVLLNGTPVWIEDFSTDKQTAQVRTLNENEQLMEVPVAALMES